MEKRTISYLTLNMVPDIGPVRFQTLLNYFGNVEDILVANAADLAQIKGIGEKIAQEIVEKRGDVRIDEELKKIDAASVRVITLEDEEYPLNLKSIWAAPPALYTKGCLKEEDRLSISMVGTRSASFYGRRMADNFAQDLARAGLTVVSGLARGIDTASHLGAISANGRTIAVLGCGVDIMYPPENKRLFEQIVQHGAVLSEFPMGTTPEKFNFPRRNRIISGLALGTLVVEASIRSGTFITTEYALEQGRDVFAVPGCIDSRLSAGTNHLIQQGAKLVTCVEDILEEIGLLVTTLKQIAIPEKKKDINELLGTEKQVYSLIGDKPQQIDYLIYNSDISAGQMASILLQLELKGFVRQLPGKVFVRE
ncbi:DNA-protecting protein DprA [Candidatus Desantisbacteria bacterium CG_4_9_14_3_um_filter_40_11]|uniref:DNA-protecting protein DprA n=2 Tax=unclassified Candidatus Desantisiibacteriota TaxID=3106372 RepID=A0A2M7P121_9BACT|nr:MAG: DNA-protecting protein DprA [Candidatus Desantisbacteria bacterium CG_4_10_14_3_um_filter_40_18]PJB29233.1 MAG: DNA-protecting protein DprA [Candidatus Desantisbacteria bacterium CG_4_9_14_3_um_filter_40_11]